MLVDTSFIPDLPSQPSPLNDYRKSAKFNWKLLKIYFEGTDCLKAKYMIWNQLERDPLFDRPPVTLTTDEQKNLATKRMKRVIEMGFLPEEMKSAPYPKRVRFRKTLFHSYQWPIGLIFFS